MEGAQRPHVSKNHSHYEWAQFLQMKEAALPPDFLFSTLSSFLQEKSSHSHRSGLELILVNSPMPRSHREQETFTKGQDAEILPRLHRSRVDSSMVDWEVGEEGMKERC